MNGEKKIIGIIGCIAIVFAMCSCCSNRRIDTDIIEYQNEIAELKARNRDLERRIESIDRTVERCIDRTDSIRARVEREGDNIDELINLFDEYQRTVEQLLSDYRKSKTDN